MVPTPRARRASLPRPGTRKGPFSFPTSEAAGGAGGGSGSSSGAGGAPAASGSAAPDACVAPAPGGLSPRQRIAVGERGRQLLATHIAIQRARRWFAQWRELDRQRNALEAYLERRQGPRERLLQRRGQPAPAP